MKLISKESTFKLFYYIIAADNLITYEETEKMNEIGFQIFGDVYPELRDNLISECEAQISTIKADPNESFDILSEYIETALNDTTDDMEQGVPSRMLLWNLLLISHSDGNYDQTEKRLLKKINRRLNFGDSVLFEMEQYIQSVQSIERELNNLKDSMEPYKDVRPIVDELENRRETIKQAVIALIDDELLLPVEKLVVQDDMIDKAQAAIKEKTDPMMKKVNEQAGKVLGEVKKAAAPAATETGKKLGKAFKGLGSKLLAKQSSKKGEE